MKNLLYTVCIITTFLVIGCQKDGDPYITKEQADQIYLGQHPPIKNVAFIYNNEVYYAADIDKPAQKITSTGGTKKLIKMSHDHTKFAYQDGLNYIQIVDNTGKSIATLTQYTQAKSFDWTADDKTLYILNNDQMYFYGPALSLPITYPGITLGYYTEILSASVSMKGDFAYIIHATVYSYSDIYRLVIKPAGSSKVITYDNNTSTYPMCYVSFSSHEQDLTLGYQRLHSGSVLLDDTEFFTGLSAYPDFSGGQYATPVYNSSLKYIVGGFVSSNFPTTKVALSAICYDDASKNKLSATYSSTNNGLYTDWK